MSTRPQPKKAELTDKQRIEQAITRIAKAFVDLAREFELVTEFLETDTRKTFAYLKQVLENTEQKSILSLAAAKAANGNFSLDDFKEPETVVMKWYAGPLAGGAAIPGLKPFEIADRPPLPPGNRSQELKEHGGRLVGGGAPQPAKPAAPADPEAEALLGEED